MYGVELYAAVRLAVVEEGLSHHEAGRRFGIDRRTVKKMLSYSAPPGYRRTKPVRRPKLDGFTGIIDAILEADADPDVPRKQRHTAHRIFERLRDEHGFTGGYTIVKDYVRSRRHSTREAFVPLHHPPGHAQVDFGEAVVEVGGQREKVAFFCLILPHSDVWFVKAYPRETTEAFLDGHVSAFAFLGGVPRSLLYDNTTLARRAVSRDALAASAPEQAAAPCGSKGDASLSVRWPGSPAPGAGDVRDRAAGAPHARDGPGGCPGNAARKGAESASAPCRRSAWSNRCCRDRSGGREPLGESSRRS